MPYFLKIAGKRDRPEVEFLTLAELAEELKRGKSVKVREGRAKSIQRTKYALQKLIDRGIIPDANYRTPAIKITRGKRIGQTITGYRLFSKTFLVPKLVAIFRNIYQGKQVTIEQRAAIIKAFEEERKYFEEQY